MILGGGIVIFKGLLGGNCEWVAVIKDPPKIGPEQLPTRLGSAWPHVEIRVRATGSFFRGFTG